MDSDYATWTYRYLRLGMLGAVVLLAISLGLVIADASDLRGSISAYYHSSARNVFVGVLLIVGFALVAYRGTTTLEDGLLNFAGTMAPFVAFVPTTGTGLEDGSKVSLETPSVDNNMTAYLLASGIGAVAAIVVALKQNSGPSGAISAARTREVVPWYGSVVALVAIGIIWQVHVEAVHYAAAVPMFIALAITVSFKAVELSLAKDGYYKWYLGIALAMVVGFAGMLTPLDNKTFWVEAWEIGLFGLFWFLRIVENWDGERVTPTGETLPTAAQPETL